MKRVVVTGLGIVSPIGNNAAEVEASWASLKAHGARLLYPGHGPTARPLP